MSIRTILEPAREIPVLDEVDVVIVGGGPAGIGAAISAGRNGARTAIIDRFGSLGGQQTNGLNSVFSLVDPEIHNGLIMEIMQRLWVSPRKVDVKNVQDTLRRAGAKVSVKDISKEALEPYEFIKNLGILNKKDTTVNVPEEEIGKY